MKIVFEAAPMAGYTDLEFRRALIRCGVKTVWTEMVSAAALYFNRQGGRGLEKTVNLLQYDKASTVIAPYQIRTLRGSLVKNVVQLFGKVPEHFEYAIKYLQDNGYEFDEININMGCPANKIIKNSEGAALMNNPELAREIIKTCTAVSKVPVSVKMRLDNVLEIAKICEQCGVSRIIVHGRFAKQGYSGTADWNAISEAVRTVKIPVTANGDIRDRESAEQCLRITNAAGVMLGRALIKYKKYNIHEKRYIIDENGLKEFLKNFM